MNRRLTLLLICIVLCIGILPAGTKAQALETGMSDSYSSTSAENTRLSVQTDISYVDGNNKPVTLTEPYTAVVNAASATIWKDGWYVADGSVEITDTITVEGDVKLILCDGAQLTTKNICVNEGNTFSVYGQSGGTGSLTARSSHNTAPGIGGGRYKNGGSINLYGGIVYAQGGKEGAGIGGSASCSHGGTVRIYGGTVTAVGGAENGAGIGGGGWDQSYTKGPYGGNGADVVIRGGTLTATGGGSAPSIGAGGSSNSHGSFSTGENGSAVIFASAIRDQTRKDQWGGIIFIGNSGTVYKDQTLTKNLTIDRGKTLTIPENTRFTVPEGVSLTNEGTIRDNGIVIKDGAIINNGTILCKVTKNFTNITADNGTGYITQGTDYSTTLTATNGRLLPLRITLSVGGKALAAGSGAYSYDSATGRLTIDKSAITGAITISAAGVVAIDAVDIRIALPQGERPLATEATCDTEGIENVALYWTDTGNKPVSGNAHYYPWCYKAHMTIVPREGYILTDSTQVSVNSEGVEERALDADGTLKVASSYYSNQAKLLGITQPEDVSDVASGTEKTAPALGLPSAVHIDTESQSIHFAAVTWDLDNLVMGSYDPASPKEQAFQVKGAITLPEEVANPDNIPLEVTIGVTVRGASANDHSHNWKTSYEWSEDGRSCTAIRVCTMDASHTETARAAVSSQVSKAADCTKAGETLYTAIFAEDWAYRQTKTVANIPATGHKLTRTGGKAASCAEAGNIEYWTCEACGKVFGDKDGMKEITLESTAVRAADHHYVNGRCTVCGASLVTNKIVLPQTGDTGPLQPLAGVLLASGITLAALARIVSRRSS